MRTKRHCRPAKRSSAAAGSCASTRGCSAGTSVNSAEQQPTTAAAVSHGRLHQLEQQVLRALVARRDLERRQRLLLRLGALAALEVALGRDRCSAAAWSTGPSASTARNSRDAASGVVALPARSGRASRARRRRTDRSRRCAGRPAAASRDRRRRVCRSSVGELARRLDVVEVDGDQRGQLGDRARRDPSSRARSRPSARAGCPARRRSAPAPRRARTPASPRRSAPPCAARGRAPSAPGSCAGWPRRAS